MSFVSAPQGSHASSHVPIPPGPINPNTGQQALLNVVNSLPVNNIPQALKNFPVPYVIYATAGGAEPVVVTNRAGAPIRIDADRSKETGQGNSGHDLIVTVDTDLTPTPNLLVTIQRLGSAPFAEDLQVAIVFPFAAFNDEDEEPGGDAPNLFIGYHSVAPFDPVTESYPPGGHAPERVEFRLIPGTLAGTDHTFDFEIDTVDAANPIRFLAGHFNAPPGAEEPEDAIAMGLLADPVPATIRMGLTVNASPIALGGPTTGSVELDWEASAPARTIFDYLENEDFPFTVSDFGTTVAFDQMPTEEILTLGVDFTAQELSLDHRGNAPVDEVIVHHRRNDGLDIRAVATNVPTEVSTVLDFGGSLEVEVSASTMGLELTAVQEGGFPGSDGLFGYPLGFFYAAGTDIPDLTTAWDMAARSFHVSASNEGEVIGSLAFVASDSGTSIDDAAVRLPPDQTHLGTGVAVPWAEADRHVFSLVDDGAHGTAAARLVRVRSGLLDFSAPDVQSISEVYELDLAEPATPLTAFLHIEPDSALLSADVQATCNVHDFPHGTTSFNLELPPPTVSFDYETDPAQGIDEVFCVGNVNGLLFEVLAGNLPPVFSFSFDPAGSFGVVAEDGSGGSQPAGVIAVRLRNPSDPDGLGAGTAALLGEVLRDARFRGDDIPSSDGTWSNTATSTQAQVDTVGTDVFLGGAQIALSTIQELSFPLHPPAGQHHYLRFTDDGPFGQSRLDAGAFGIDSFSYSSAQGGGNRMLEASYATEAARMLELEVTTGFGGPFFPDFAVDASLLVDAIPAQWSLTTDLATVFEHAASSDVASITLDAYIDDTDDGHDNGTVIDLVAEGLPAEVTYALDPTGTAQLDMSGPMSQLSLSMTSDAAILGSGYQLIEATLEDIPARWEADWTDGSFSLEARDTAGQPTPLGSLSARVSTAASEAANAQKLQPFTHEDACRVAYSPFLQDIDWHYYQASGAPSVLDRLNAVYCDGAALQTEPAAEDHVIVRNAGGSVDFASLQFTGFQRVLVQGDDTGGRFELRAPTAGPHPLFLGIGDGFGATAEFTTVWIEDLPDEIDAEIDVTSGFTFQASDSAGTVDVYRGPLPTAGPGATALRVTIDPLPATIEAAWSPDWQDGEISFEASSPFEVRLLNQDSATRVVGALRLQNFQASWQASGIGDADTIGPSISYRSLIPPWPTDSFGPMFLRYAHVSLSFEADPGLSGFLNVYEGIGDPQPLKELVEGTPRPDPDTEGGEYVPRHSFLLKDFEHFDASVSIVQCLPVPPLHCLPAPDFSLGVIHSFNGDLDKVIYDFWDRGEDPQAITGDPDYIDNSPWHVWPLLHSFGTHFDPFD